MQDNQLIYGLGYVTTLSIITPPLIGYNVKKLYCCKGNVNWFKASLKMFPGQFVLRASQLKLATIIKENTNQWLAFSFIGVLQGFVYGHATTNWTKYLKLPIKSRPNPMNGILYAASRDTISQGIPFALSSYGPTIVFTASIFSTIASQGLHNCQTIMQIKSHLSYKEAMKKGWQRHGLHILYMGVEARLGMMSTINMLNYYLLKDIWK